VRIIPERLDGLCAAVGFFSQDDMTRAQALIYEKREGSTQALARHRLLMIKRKLFYPAAPNGRKY
jgi:hypothetical protein